VKEIAEYNIFQALKLVRAHALAPFKETIDIAVRLNVDPKHGDQVVRGIVSMPYGVGKIQRVCVFAPESMKAEALQAGADIFGDKKTLIDIKNGLIDFERLIATPEASGDLKPFAKILGPKGLMPNLKVGTLVTVDKLEKAILDAKRGSVQYRVDGGKNIHSPLGKIDFEDEKIIENLKALMKSLIDKKPNNLKGTYFNTAYLSSTQGPGWKIKIETIDIRNKDCLIVSNV